jgi:hypothetical protein
MVLSTSSLFADFSYRENTKITGGAVMGAMKVAGALSKNVRESMDTTATVAVKGNRMAHRSAYRLSLIDLDARTITDVDLQKKQYSVMTFDEMKQALEAMSKKMKENQNADVKLRVSADATGKTKDISGYATKEVLVKIVMEMTDPKTNQNGSMVVFTDLWIADNVPGYAEVKEFYKKMAEQLNWTPGGGMFTQQPEIAKGMAEAFKEVSKMNGAPVFQKMVMGPEGIQPPSSDAPQPAAQEKPKPSAGSVIGGALGGRFGLGKKKSDPPPQEQQPQQGSAPSGSMIEMETHYSDFATTADASLFEIPAGLKQVESEIKKIK